MTDLPKEHSSALARADDADRALARGDVDSAAKLYADAARLEESALWRIPVDKRRTIGILGVSATALWYEAAEYDKAIALATKLLSTSGLDPNHRAELDDIVAAVPFKIVRTGTADIAYFERVKGFDESRRARLRTQLVNILAAAHEKEEELTTLYAEHASLLRYVATHKFRVPAEHADDLVSEVFISYVRTLPEIVHVRAWLVAAVCNASRHYWRAQGRFETLADDFDQIYDPTTALDAHITVDQVLAALPQRCRELLHLYFFQGLTVVEISQELGVTVTAVHSRRQRCMTQARAAYARLLGKIKG